MANNDDKDRIEMRETHVDPEVFRGMIQDQDMQEEIDVQELEKHRFPRSRIKARKKSSSSTSRNTSLTKTGFAADLAPCPDSMRTS